MSPNKLLLDAFKDPRKTRTIQSRDFIMEEGYNDQHQVNEMVTNNNNTKNQIIEKLAFPKGKQYRQRHSEYYKTKKIKKKAQINEIRNESGKSLGTPPKIQK